MNKRAVALIVGVLTVALLAAGCGGGDDNTSASATGAEAVDSGSEPTPTTKAEFVTQANAVCAEGKKEIEKELESPKADLTGSTVAGLQLEIDGISALGPQSEERQVKVMLNDLRAAIAKAEKDLEQANERLAHAEKLGTEYGLTGCFID